MIKVCLIDDDDIAIYTAKRILKLCDSTCEVVSYVSTEDAMVFFENGIDNQSLLPDLLFIDINMPLIDGFQFIAQLKELGVFDKKQFLVCMLSSAFSAKDILNAETVPEITCRIEKPLAKDAVLQLLQEVSK